MTTIYFWDTDGTERIELFEKMWADSNGYYINGYLVTREQYRKILDALSGRSNFVGKDGVTQ